VVVAVGAKLIVVPRGVNSLAQLAAKSSRIPAMKGRIASIAVATAALLLAVAAGIPAESWDVRLPSESTGGGTLAVRVSRPDDPRRVRYGDSGAPCAIYIPGAYIPGQLNVGDTPDLLAQGFVVVTYLFPGGVDPNNGSTSDGVYDDRGDACQQATRDVALFAQGLLTDDKNETISEIAGVEVLSANVGIYGYSNGGTIALTTLGRYGDNAGTIAWLAGFENPSNDQVSTNELGTRADDANPFVDADGDGFSDNDGANGAYAGFEFPSFAIDYSVLTFDADYVWTMEESTHTGILYFDNNSNGEFDAQTGGPLVPDPNGNGVLDVDEDYPCRGLAREDRGEWKGILSIPAAEAVEAQQLKEWPAAYFSADESREYWGIRNATTWLPRALENQPRMACITAFSILDHVQWRKDFPQTNAWAEGFSRSKHWYRLNADRAYLQVCAGQSLPLAADWPANDVPAPEDFFQAAQPEGAVIDKWFIVAAATELADRTQFNNWSRNLTAPIWTMPVEPGLTVR